MHILYFFIKNNIKIIFPKVFLQYIRMDNLNVTKSEYIKTLKNRGISIKRSASKHEILK